MSSSSGLFFLSHRFLEERFPFVPVDGRHRRDLDVSHGGVHDRCFHSRLVVRKVPDCHDIVFTEAIVGLDQLAAERLGVLLDPSRGR